MPEEMAANSGSRLVYFLVGLSLGAVITALFTPKSGDETRDYVSQKTNELKDCAAAVVDQAKDVVAQKTEQLTGAIEAAQQTYKAKAAAGGTES